MQTDFKISALRNGEIVNRGSAAKDLKVLGGAIEGNRIRVGNGGGALGHAVRHTRSSAKGIGDPRVIVRIHQERTSRVDAKRYLRRDGDRKEKIRKDFEEIQHAGNVVRWLRPGALNL